MKERIIASTCPHCGHVFHIKRDTMAVAGMNSMIDQRLHDGTYFTHLCSKCHRLYYLEQPFLYHDPDHRYILIVSDKERIPPLFKNEEGIRCKNVMQFLFCFRVMSQGLDIRLVLQKKRALETKLHQFVTFDTYNSECLWFKTRDDVVAVRLHSEELCEIYRSK